MSKEYIDEEMVRRIEEVAQQEEIKNSKPSKVLEEVLMFIQELLNISETEKHFINLANYETRLNLIKTKQALIRLESIDNAKPSEALESLELTMKVLTKIFGKEVLNEHNINFDTIKQALIQAEKDKEIIRNLKAELKEYEELKKPITEEEHNKFKENL